MKDNILKIMLITIILNVLVVCITIFSKSVYAISLDSISSFSGLLTYVIPFWLYTKIVDDEEHRKLASIGSVLALVTTIFSALNTLDIISSGVFLAKMVSALSIVIWVLAGLSFILSIRSVNGIVDLLKKVATFLTIILGLMFIVFMLTGSVSDGFMLKLVYALLVVDIGIYIGVFLSSKFYKKEITDLELSEKEFRSNNSENIQNNVMGQAIANTVAAHNNVVNQNTTVEPVNEVQAAPEPVQSASQDVTLNNQQM